MKAINENLLTCGYVQAYAYARNARGCAIVRLLGRGMEKWGGKRKKVGEEAKRVGERNGRGVDREMKVVQGVKNEGARNEKAFTLCEKGSTEKIKGEISRRSARSAGKYRKSKEKVSFGAEKSDVPSKNHRKLDSKWENGKGNRR